MSSRVICTKNIVIKVSNFSKCLQWMDALRLQDFKSVYEYNSALYIITSQLKLCVENITDEDILEKNIYNVYNTS